MDQGISSATNALAVLLAAGVLSAGNFGWFSLGVTVAALSTSLIRPLSGMLLVLLASDQEGPGTIPADHRAAGAGLAWGSVVGGSIAAAGLLVPASGRSAVVVIGCCIPLLAVQDALRYVAFRRGRPWSAALSDTIWLLVVLVLLVPLRESAIDSPGLFLGAWAAGAAVAALVALVQLRVRPTVRRGLAWSWSNRHVGRYLLGELAAAHGSGQLAILIVGWLAGAAAIGAFRGGLTLLGALTVVQMATIAFAMPELVRRPHLSRRHRLLVASLISGPLALATLATGWALPRLPREIGTALLGDAWDGAAQVIFPLATWTAAGALSIGPLCVLQSMGNARSAARISGVLAPLLLTGALVGVTLGGMRGGAWGMAAGQAAVLMLWWPTLVHQSRRRPVAAEEESHVNSPDRRRSEPDEVGRP